MCVFCHDSIYYASVSRYLAWNTQSTESYITSNLEAVQTVMANAFNQPRDISRNFCGEVRTWDKSGVIGVTPQSSSVLTHDLHCIVVILVNFLDIIIFPFYIYLDLCSDFLFLLLFFVCLFVCFGGWVATPLAPPTCICARISQKWSIDNSHVNCSCSFRDVRWLIQLHGV